jgi:hypothetical protein
MVAWRIQVITDPTLVQEAQPLEFYRRRRLEICVRTDDARRTYDTARMALAISLLLTFAALYQIFVTKAWPVWSVAVAIPVVAYTAYQTKRYQDRLRKLQSLHDYYAKGVARLGLAWDALDEGSDFIDPRHLYATDLDLFGRGSVFQVLCSARTKAGRERLASWMKAAATLDEARARQAAISELLPRNDLRETIAAAGAKAGSEVQASTWQTWLSEASAPFPVWAGPVAFILALCVIVLAVLFGGWLMDWHAFFFGRTHSAADCAAIWLGISQARQRDFRFARSFGHGTSRSPRTLAHHGAGDFPIRQARWFGGAIEARRTPASQ